MTARTRARKIAKGVAIGVALLPVIAAALVALAFASLRIPAVERFALTRTNAVLADVFEGRIVLEHVTETSLSSARVDGYVLDPEGNKVIVVRGARAGLFWPKLVWDIVHSANPLVIDIGDVSVHDSVVHYVDAGDGSPTLALAFQPRKSPEPKAPSPPTETKVFVRSAHIDHAWVYGAAGSVALDADVSAFQGTVQVDATRWSVGMSHAEIVARALPEAIDPRGVISGKVSGLLEGSAPPDAEAHFAGTLAATPVDAEATFTGGHLTAKANAPDIAPAVVKRFVPALAPMDRSRLSVTAEGKLPDVNAIVEVGSGDAAVRADAHYTGKRASAKLTTSKVDLSRFVEGAVKTSLDATIDVDAALAGEASDVDGKYVVKLHGARVDGELLPNLDLAGHARLDAPKWSVKGTAEVDEAGAPTHLEYEVTGNGGKTDIVGELDARLDKPRRLVALAGVTASGRVHAIGRFEPETAEFTTKAEARLTEVSVGTISAANVEADLAATGPLKNPIVNAKVSMRPLRLPGRVFDRAVVSAKGKLERADVEAELAGKKTEVRAYSTVSAAGGRIAFEKPSVTLTDKEGIVRLATDRFALDGRRIQVDHLTVEGAGHAEVSLVYDGDLRRLQLETQDLDVGRLLRIAELDKEASAVPSARLSVVGSYAEDRGQPAALLRGKVRGIQYEQVKNGTADLDLTLKGRVLGGKVRAELGNGADVTLALEDVTFDGKVTSPKLDSIRGRAILDGTFYLTNLRGVFALREVPFEDADGKVVGTVVIERTRMDRLPKVTAHFGTEDFALVGKRPTEDEVKTSREAVEAAGWTIRGIDFGVDGEAGGDDNEVNVQARIVGDAGELATIDAHVELPQDATTIGDVVTHIDEAKGGLVFRVPARRFRQFPEFLRPRSAAGTLSLVLEADGSLHEPHVNVFGQIDRFGASGQRTVDEESTRVDVAFEGDYRKTGGNLKVSAAYKKSQSTGEVLAMWKGDAAELARAESGPSPIVGEVKANIDAFPLAVIPQAKNRQIGGTLSGNVVVTGIGKAAEAHGKLQIAPFTLGQITLDKAGVAVDTKGDQLAAKAWASGDGGTLAGTLRTKLVWKDALVPVIDPNLQGHVSTKRFRMGVATPFLAGIVSEVDGRIDAELDAALNDGVPKLDGHAEFDSGTLSIPAIGQQMSDIRGKFVLSPKQAKLTDFYARGETGKLSATATVDFADKFQLAGAHAEVKIGEDDKLPITLEGVTIGDAWGKIEATAKNDPAANELKIEIDVPELHVDLPDTGTADVQALDSDPHVRIGAVRKDGGFVIVPTQPLESAPARTDERRSTSIVDIKLGKIEIRKSEEVRIELTGQLQAKIADQTELSGEILTTGGQLDVQGKRFEVERGTIRFNGENPPNPTIVAVARWDSPFGYRVYAEYSGTAKKAKLTLRSDPPLSQDQVLSLLLFGTPDGQFGQGSGGNTAAGVALAGGTATKGINRALSDLTDLDVQARIDTSTGAARPEVVFQISNRVAARVTRAIGDPIPGTAPDRTFLTLEFRVKNHWLLSTLVGDRGATALDLLWRVRY